MIEPVALQDFFLTFFSAAMVIMTGGLYALLFAYARLKRYPRLMPLAYVAYQVGDTLVLSCALATLGAVLGFFVWNYPLGLIFLGDGGAVVPGVQER